MSEQRAKVDWRGYIPAITTPFGADEELDLSGLGRLLEWLHGEGMHGLIIAGTTGEWTSLSASERKQLFQAVGSQMGGKLPLIAGATAYTPGAVLDFATAAAEYRFDGVLVTPPPYCRPNDEEIVGFFSEVAESSPLPVCVYNWPPGTGIDMSVRLLERLAELENVVAIKQSTSNLRAFMQTFFALSDRVRIFGHSMDDHGLAVLRSCGGDGTMGAGAVLGRVQPDFYNHLWAGDFEAARACGKKDRVLMDEWYTEDLVGRFGSGPAIMKAALNVRGLPGGRVRRPLRDVSPQHVERIEETLRSLGCL
ncbi:dihydrodipicolinate synthase family protein [Sphingosinicella sp. CPCC 101087]|uniref:dihydrodipicolinate synthase family protein n=1 Tax=Sphingosinicella sp. CPCC 101087 TaxID=2497754 RepID=UPI00101D97E3|nr:dihydrodipicolinate synthase family protein [Sphingosinicella sp. CPCC 101087]